MENHKDFTHKRNPFVYSFRTNSNILRLLRILSAKEHRYKNDIMEDALIEYFERHFNKKYCAATLKLFENDLSCCGFRVIR